MKALLDENEVANCWRKEITAADRISIAMALVTARGFSEIRQALKDHLSEHRECKFLVGVDLASAPETLAELFEMSTEDSALSVRRFQSSGGQIFHPKFGVFHRGGKPARAILGSSNMTQSAFTRNCEANVHIDHKKTVKALADYFEKHWEDAKPLDEQWLKDYQALWSARKKAEEHTKKVREKVVKIGRKRSTPTGEEKSTATGKKTGTETAGVPKRIKDQRFVFTGRIEDWPRDGKLYPKVRKLGGTIVTEADRIQSGDCLVRGEILGESEETVKLNAAERLGIAVVTVEKFFEIMKRELALRKRARSKK